MAKPTETIPMVHKCPVCKAERQGTNRAVEWCHCLGDKQPTRMIPQVVADASNRAMYDIGGL